MTDFKTKMHQVRLRLGLRPRPRWGACSAPPHYLADLRGPTSKGRVGEGGGGKGGGCPVFPWAILATLILCRENPAPLEWAVVLKWFYSLSRRKTFVGGKCALPSALLVWVELCLFVTKMEILIRQHLTISDVMFSEKTRMLSGSWRQVDSNDLKFNIHTQHRPIMYCVSSLFWPNQ